MKKRFVAALVVSFLGAIAALRAGDEVPRAPAGPVGLLSVPGMPTDLDVNNAPLADWIKPGARFTFFEIHGVHYFAYNQITPAQPGDNLLSFRDPDDPSRWMSIHALRSEAIPRLAEAWVIGIAKGKVYCLQRLWQPGVAGQKWLVPVSGTGVLVFPVGMFGERYVSPTLLEKIAVVDTPEQKIHRTTTTVDGKEVPALAFFTTASKSNAWYNLETGLMVKGSDQFQDKNYDFVVAGQSPQGALVVNTSNLKTLRQVTYPWLGKPVPDWVAKVKTFTVKRKVVLTANPQPAGPQTLLDDQATMRVIERVPIGSRPRRLAWQRGGPRALRYRPMSYSSPARLWDPDHCSSRLQAWPI